MSAPPTTVGQYRLSQKIGEGGMGVVYVAEHTLLGRLAAVKLLLPALSQNREIVARFFNEARAATAIRHPGIVEVYDFGYSPDGSAYIVMEYLQGESLAARARRGRISYRSALAITRQIAGALAAAHGKGIVHRDLKPDNVFLVPDAEVPGGERIKLLDFGIAKLAADPSQSMQQLTQTGAVMGTPTYMSPEQCRGVSVDARSDLYSLGCMLFELCTGRPPFVGEGFGDVLAAHIHLPPPSVVSIAPDVPAPLDLLVRRLLAKDPAQRLGSAEEIIHAIDQASGAPGYQTGPRWPGGDPAGMRPTPRTTLSSSNGAHASPRTVPAPSRARLGWIAGAGAVAVLGGLAAFLAADRDEAAPAGAAELRATASPSQPLAVEAPATALASPSQPLAAEAPATALVAPAAAAPAPAAAAPAAAAAAPVAVEPVEIAISVQSQPAGADVLLDGALLGKTPYRGALPRGEGTVTLVLRLAGYKDRKLTAPARAPITETVKLEKKKSQPIEQNRDRGVNPFAN
jgi:hypothetical protein